MFKILHGFVYIHGCYKKRWESSMLQGVPRGDKVKVAAPFFFNILFLKNVRKCIGTMYDDKHPLY